MGRSAYAYRRGRWRGYVAIETYGLLVVVAIVSGIFGMALLRTVNDGKQQAAAQHLRTFHQAADGYVRANYSALVTATAGGPVAVTVAQLVTAGYLDPGVAASGFINPYGQVPAAWIRTVTCAPTACPNRLQLVTIMTGLPVLDIQTIAGIATRANGMGALAGFVPATSPTRLVRVFGAGNVDLTAYAALGAPGAGRAGAISFYDGSQLSSDWLARYSTGNAEDNRMHTAIDMNGNDVTNGGTIQANDFQITGKGNAWASGAIGDAQVVASGAVFTKPTCPHGSPQIYTSVVNAAADAAGTLWSSVQTWAVDNGASWTINMRVRTAGGWVTPADGFGNVLALAKCG